MKLLVHTTDIDTTTILPQLTVNIKPLQLNVRAQRLQRVAGQLLPIADLLRQSYFTQTVQMLQHCRRHIFIRTITCLCQRWSLQFIALLYGNFVEKNSQ